MKQTFKVPEGCKEVTIEQIDNQIITTFEPPKSEFKKGDVLVTKSNDIIIFDSFRNFELGKNVIFYHAGLLYGFSSELEIKEDEADFGIGVDSDIKGYATPEEKERLLTAMHEAGKDFDFEKMEIVDYYWEPERGEDYYIPFFSNENHVEFFTWANDRIDNNLFSSGQVCKTKEQAIELANKMLNAIKK